jgi:phosphoribulokinase
VILRDTLPHPDLSPLLDGTAEGPSLVKREREWLLRIPGDLDEDHAAALEEAVWERMSFANHLRIRRLGEFTVGTDLRRSDSLALVQLLILYQVVTARAALAIGGSPPRAEGARPTGADSALHT